MASWQSFLILAVAVSSQYSSWVSLLLPNTYRTHLTIPSSETPAPICPVFPTHRYGSPIHWVVPLSSKTQTPAKQQPLPLQRSEFQLCLAPPLSFCVLIISASFLCSFSPRVITVSAIRTSISSISPFTPSVTWLIIYYIKFSLFKLRGFYLLAWPWLIYKDLILTLKIQFELNVISACFPITLSQDYPSS